MSTKSQVFEFPGLRWTDAYAPSKEFLNGIEKNYRIPRSMAKDCLEPDHLPKYEQSGSIHFLILRAYDTESNADSHSIQEISRKIAIFWGPDFIITLHRKDFPWMQRLRDSWAARAQESGATVLPLLLEGIVEEAIHSFEPAIDSSTTALEQLEDRIIEEGNQAHGASADLLERAYRIRRNAGSLKRLFRLTRELHSPLIRAGEGQNLLLQNLKEDAERLYHYADDISESVSDLLQLYISLTSNHMNESSFKTNEVMRFLTIFSVFFMPLNFIVGVYGMNFEFMPELKHPLGYPAVILGMISVEAMIYVWFRRKGWMK